MGVPPLSLIVPVYNERRGLPPVVDRLRAVLEKLPAGSEILLVDDGSTDGTAHLFEQLRKESPPGFRLLTHPRNRGYGAALKTGLRAAVNELVAITDADGTYPVERLPELAGKMADGQVSMLVGERPAGQQPAIRRPAKIVLTALAEYLTGESIPDLNSGLRLFRCSDALRLSNLLPDGFSFTTTITMALLTEGERVLFVPIRYRKRVGSSKIRPLRDTANFLLLICRTALAFNPMKVFGPVGLGLLAVGAAMLVLRMLLDNPFGVASTIIFLVGGLQILALGLLADLVNRRGGRP